MLFNDENLSAITGELVEEAVQAWSEKRGLWLGSTEFIAGKNPAGNLRRDTVTLHRDRYQPKRLHGKWRLRRECEIFETVPGAFPLTEPTGNAQQ